MTVENLVVTVDSGDSSQVFEVTNINQQISIQFANGERVILYSPNNTGQLTRVCFPDGSVVTRSPRSVSIFQNEENPNQPVLINKGDFKIRARTKGGLNINISGSNLNLNIPSNIQSRCHEISENTPSS